MITARCYPEGVARQIDPRQISEEVRVRDQLIWVDIIAPRDSELAMVQEEFSLHAQAM